MRHARHRGALIEKWKESLRSVLPITAIVIALGLLAVPAPSGAMLAFLAGAGCWWWAWDCSCWARTWP